MIPGGWILLRRCGDNGELYCYTESVTEITEDSQVRTRREISPYQVSVAEANESAAEFCDSTGGTLLRAGGPIALIPPIVRIPFLRTDGGGEGMIDLLYVRHQVELSVPGISKHTFRWTTRRSIQSVWKPLAVNL